MIVTLTLNPAVDRTLTLSEPLERGGVLRSSDVHDDAGGKGVNVAQVVRNGGGLAVAVLPGDHDDPLLVRLRELRLTHRAVPIGRPSRVNLTLAEADGTTTKVNARGAELDADHLARLLHEVESEAAGARWVVLSGSMPPGVPAEWYADAVSALAVHGVSIALDTSGAPLREAVKRVPQHLDVIKPNEEELGELVGVDPSTLTDVASVVAAARPLVDSGIGAVLVTLGGDGAVLVTPDAVWTAPVPRIQARSTVGAGDSALAGYLLASLDGRDAAGRLALAVSYGSAAASLPGSQMPTPGDLPPLTEAVRWNEG